jgi:molybdopterin molybdotransferase
MIDHEKAFGLVLSGLKALGPESVVLAEAPGRTLARDIKARENIPPFDKATMDGYAVRAVDTRPAGKDGVVELEVIEDVPAGRLPGKPIGPGQAVRIMTGAPLPKGADAVVMVEDTAKRGARVALRRAVRPGDNIGRAGEDLKKGESVLERGAVIGPAEAGMLAAAGLTRVPVVRRPKLAVIATGDEIVEPGEKKRPGQIRNSNGPAVMALARRAKGADILVLTGGVSVGDYDKVKDELRASGVRPVFWGVRIKPGKPLFFGRRGRQSVFGLPGNPTSAMVTFLLFVQPAIERLLGRKTPGPVGGRAVLMEDIVLTPGRKQFLRAVLDAGGPTLKVTPYPDQRSGVLRSMVRSRVLIVVPAEVSHLEKGCEVEILYREGR